MRHTVACKIAKRQGSLTLNLEARAIHELHEARDQLVFGLRELLPVERCVNVRKNVQDGTEPECTVPSTAILLRAVVQ